MRSEHVLSCSYDEVNELVAGSVGKAELLFQNPFISTCPFQDPDKAKDIWAPFQSRSASALIFR